jgi:Fe-S cluster assembly iron-binding protein IscA
MPEKIKATEVRVGDRLLARSGVELTVTRIDQQFLGGDAWIAFVEDSEQQWFKMPAPRDGEVDLVSRAAA